MTKPYKDLEDYGIIGNLETCALVGRDGSIDWLCLPYLESPSQFAALLDAERGGHFSVRPSLKYKSLQMYLDDSNVLRTVFTTSLGRVEITDFMPVDKPGHQDFVRAVFRRIEWREGEVELDLDFQPRFDYARADIEWDMSGRGAAARSPRTGERLFLQAPVSWTVRDGSARARLRGKHGDAAWLVLQYGGQAELTPEACRRHLSDTERYWRRWAHGAEPSVSLVETPWRQLVIRSGLILKLLANPDTGAIAAAATTSLPERPGGPRNWDYRYAWIRDSAFTVQALYHIGQAREARDFHRWIKQIAHQHPNPAEIRILYGVHGEADTREQILEHLSGYRDSCPVRIGNAAAGQRQHDIFGELIGTLYETTRYGEDISRQDWSMIRGLVDYVCRIWETPDAGIWEMRGDPRHFVYSKLMCWVAVDRGLKIAREKEFAAPLEEWERAAAAIREAILTRGFNPGKNSFVQAFDGDELDATALLIPVQGFLPPDDPRVLGTIDAVLRELTNDRGLVRRYRADDGLPGEEGHFLLCSFWLVKALSLAGRVDEAEAVYRNVLKTVSSLGLLSEEVDDDTGKLLGNLPQAFSHIGLINGALYLGIAQGKSHRGPKPLGVR